MKKYVWPVMAAIFGGAVLHHGARALMLFILMESGLSVWALDHPPWGYWVTLPVLYIPEMLAALVFVPVGYWIRDIRDDDD
jgi:hypothetical protein